MRLTDQHLCFPSPAKGVLVYGCSFYVGPTGVEMIRQRSIETRDDLIDTVKVERSDDNGATWSQPVSQPVCEKTVAGTRRFTFNPGWVDPINGRLLEVGIEALFREDVAAEGMTQYFIRYRTSPDGGLHYDVDEQAVQQGDYTTDHPFAGVWIGRNAMMLGDRGSEPIRTRSGRVLVPVQVTPLGPDGEAHNPGGGYTFHDAAVLLGRWCDDGRITWDLSDMVHGDPAHSTRGWIEPTIAQLPDDRIMMVLRGSNDVEPHLPGRKWLSVSQDEGDTWTAPRPWTYDDGEPFFSPSSMSQLLWHSSGRLLWLGNILPQNPSGNYPRYPLVIAEVDPEHMTLRRDSLFVVDDRKPGESMNMTLSNFYAYVDRLTDEIVLHMSRWFMDDSTGDAYVYRIAID